MIRVTRGDYLKYFVRDEKGNYCGTEPEGVGLRLLRERDRLAAEEQADGKKADGRSGLSASAAVHGTTRIHLSEVVEFFDPTFP